MDKAMRDQISAVILAAGFGSRISDVTDKPKCLLEINGESLLKRHLRIWKGLKIKKVNLVLGYKSELILEKIRSFEDDFEFHIYYNNNFREFGNTYSLLLGIESYQAHH